jgi:hypothetical protein
MQEPKNVLSATKKERKAGGKTGTSDIFLTMLF